MSVFRNGQEVTEVTAQSGNFYWQNGTRNITAMTISMESGQMAGVAFVRVDHPDGRVTMLPCANMDSVTLAAAVPSDTETDYQPDPTEAGHMACLERGIDPKQEREP